MQKSVPDGFIEHPVYTHLDGEFDSNGMDEASCSEAYEVNVQAEEDQDSAFFTHQDVLEKLRQPIAQAFNMSLEQKNFLKMRDFIGYCDILYSRKKAGLPDLYNFTEQQWH